uniref:Reverse transcriptase domain-containing protein n=1 Tax=Latimeria chalumnae TaxID=7897 RepID=M3XLH7_LATCH
MITDASQTATVLNDYFISVFTKEEMSNLTKLAQEPPSGLAMCNSIQITSRMVADQLGKIRVNKSQGPDGMHPRVLKELSNEISGVLAVIFQKSLESGVVPKDWRRANVTPIYKKGCKSDPGNYRPISLTSVVGKIMETIVKNSILVHLETQGVIKNSQFGFTKGRSCQTNLLVFYEAVTKEMDKGNAVDVIFLDFSKAFDTVPHKRLLLKLKQTGIGGNLFCWIQNWLMDRSQRVMVQGIASDWKDVKSGVPQGSVLGPLLFNIFINDLEEGVKSTLVKFADDTKMMKVLDGDSACDELQKDLDTLQTWAVKWQMKFNVGKCKVLHLGVNNPKRLYHLNDQKLESADNEKDLGIIIDDKLKFSHHSNMAVSKANKMLGVIKRTITSRKMEVITPLYRALVRPHLEYCVQFWSPRLRCDIESVERVQRRATRLIEGMEGLNYSERLQKLHMFTLEKRRMRGDMITVFKILHDPDTMVQDELFHPVNESRTRGHNLRVRGGKFKTNVRKYYFSERVVKLWNMLPCEAVEAKSINVFKNELDKFLMRKNIVCYDC